MRAKADETSEAYVAQKQSLEERRGQSDGELIALGAPWAKLLVSPVLHFKIHHLQPPQSVILLLAIRAARRLMYLANFQRPCVQGSAG